MEMPPGSGACFLFLGHKFLDGRVWRRCPSALLAASGTSRKCHRRPYVRAIGQSSVCARDAARRTRGPVSIAIPEANGATYRGYATRCRFMIEEILFPVDFSQSSAAISPFVQRAATIFQSRVSLLYVCDLTSHNGFELYVRSLQEIAEEHWNIARRKLDSFLESDFPVSSCPRILRSGNTAEQIATVARSDGFDLIIMPTHAGRFRRMLLGSTTAKVLNDAACPVLTTEHAEAIVPSPLEHREWLCALAINADSERVLDLANRGASAAGAKLSLIHVLRNCGPAKLDCAEEQKARQCIAELQKSVRSDAMLHIVQGPLKDALLAAVQQSSADVLIIGRPQSESLGRLRDLTYGVIRDAPCPVLSV